MPRKGPSTVEERLHRIEGQIRGIERLVQEGEDTQKVLIQLQAAISSLESVKMHLIKQEIRESILKSVDEAVDLLK